MSKRMVQFSIYRYDPDKDDAPYMQDISVELEPTDRKLLDALTKLKAKDDAISYRRSCREGVCGSDAMNINGKNGLACLTDIDSLKQPIVLRPLPGLPVIRDLIVDMTQFFKQYHSIKPYLINNDPPPERERLQSPEDREELNGLYECILCACCSTSCPSFWWNPDKFVGPAGEVVIDANRNGVGPTYITEVTKSADGSLFNKVVKTVPNVTQTLGLPEAEFKKMGLGTRDIPDCRK